MTSTVGASEIKERFLAEVGSWPAAFDDLVRLDPDFVEACLEFSAVPRRQGALDPKVRDFVHVALEVSVTHMHPERARSTSPARSAVAPPSRSWWTSVSW